MGLRSSQDAELLLRYGIRLQADQPAWELIVPAPGGKVWGVNTDRNANPIQMWRHQKTVSRAVRAEAAVLRIPRQQRIVVLPTIYLRQWRRADPQNYLGGSSLKAALDALTDEKTLLSRRPRRFVTVPNGIVPDDRPEHMIVLGPDIRPIGEAPTPASQRAGAFAQASGTQPTVQLTITPANQEDNPDDR